ncbi:FtsB family cell division protein [Kocuria sp.]|uniref:FtsB family cell division protein n=1 Tax=Kocuria sp. TaxID=1871328 RepID=UPI0026DF3EC2|nr:septum formation initiator family protein [Kocuria sp.]MDO5617541.1 septum formation initiator family protein [Kocuria sp.]
MPTGDQRSARTASTDSLSVARVARGFSARRRLLLVIVTILLIVFLAAPTTKIYLDQRAEINALQQNIAQTQTSRDELERQVKLWDDPEYVRQQARERLLMVEPGQRSYLVVGADAVGDQAPQSSAVQEEADRAAWADALWGSVLDAGWPQERTSSSQAENFPQLGGGSVPEATETPIPAPSSDAETNQDQQN